MLNNNVLTKILAETFDDATASACNTGLHFRLYDSTAFVGYFASFKIVEICDNTGGPKVTPRFLCFNTEGVRTSCDPHFEDIEERNAYMSTMRELMYFNQQIDIKNKLDAITGLHPNEISANS